MRIAIPDNPGPDSFADNVSDALREMGHDVLMPPRRSGSVSGVRVAFDGLCARAGVNPLTRQERWLRDTVRSTRVDVVLALTQSIRPDVLREAKARQVRWRIAWWGDPPANLKHLALLSSEWDLVCLKDPAGVAKFRRIGLNAILLHEAMNPRWHRPMARRTNDDVVLAGNYYGYRQCMASRLIAQGVSVGLYGNALPRWGLPSLRPHHRGRYIVREEKSRVFGEALACLNTTSFAEGNSLNCRAFEIAGAAGLQIIEGRPMISECFDPGAEVLVFDTWDGLVELLDRARADPGGLADIREAGARRAKAQHTYQMRLTSMFASLQ